MLFGWLLLTPLFSPASIAPNQKQINNEEVEDGTSRVRTTVTLVQTEKRGVKGFLASEDSDIYLSIKWQNKGI